MPYHKVLLNFDALPITFDLYCQSSKRGELTGEHRFTTHARY